MYVCLIHLSKQFRSWRVHFLKPKFIQNFFATIVPSHHIVVSADIEVEALLTKDITIQNFHVSKHLSLLFLISYREIVPIQNTVIHVDQRMSTYFILWNTNFFFLFFNQINDMMAQSSLTRIINFCNYKAHGRNSFYRIIAPGICILIRWYRFFLLHREICYCYRPVLPLPA